MKDIVNNELEIKVLEGMAQASAEQPLLKMCPLCGERDLTLAVALLNSRQSRSGHITGQREYYCVNCKADFAIHFAAIKPHKKDEFPIFNIPPPKREVVQIQCTKNPRCALPNGHVPNLVSGDCLLRELNGDSW